MDLTWQTCRRKRWYKTRAAARKKARTLGKRLFAYQCPSCGKWHLTHYSPSEAQRFERHGER